MEEPLQPLVIPPGLFKQGTGYQSAGRWSDANGIRFRQGTIQPIRGWTRLLNSAGTEFAALDGCPRGALAYQGDSGDSRLIFGTTTKLYVITGGVLYSITPDGVVSPSVALSPGSCFGSLLSGSGAFGDGAFGAGPFGGLSVTETIVEGDTWQLDNFGNSLLATLTSDGRLLVWNGDPSQLADEPRDGMDNPVAPQLIRGLVVTPERFVFTLGGTPVAGGDVNPRLVQWPTQETLDDWTPTATNSAGDFILASPGVLLAGRRARRQTLLWTTTECWTATYIGDPAFYQFDTTGEGGLLAPNAVATFGDQAVWMSRNCFYVFNGRPIKLQCEIADYIFGDLDPLSHAAINCRTREEFDEVEWNIPTTGSTGLCNRRVRWNYRENHWAVDQLPRAASIDRGASPVPVFVDTQGFLWEDDTGFDRQGLQPYLTSGPIEVGNGDQVMRIQSVIPDENTKGDLALRILTRFSPTGDGVWNPPFTTDPYSLNDAAPIDVRLTARQVQLRFEEAREADWRLGTFRFGARPQGKR